MKNRKREMLYIAYGSNLNLEQMKRRCPTAAAVGRSVLEGWRLVFRGGAHGAVATIEREAGSSVPIGLWSLGSGDEAALDIYEGWPRLYRKEMLEVEHQGRKMHAMVYIMNDDDRHPYGLPSFTYYDTIREGYRMFGFDRNILDLAVKQSGKRKGGTKWTKE